MDRDAGTRRESVSWTTCRARPVRALRTAARTGRRVRRRLRHRDRSSGSCTPRTTSSPSRATVPKFLPLIAERFARQRLRALAKVEGLHDDGKPTCCSSACTTPAARRWRWGSSSTLAGDRAVAWSGGSEPASRSTRPPSPRWPSAASTSAGVPQAVDRRDRPRGRRGDHHGLRRRLPDLPRQALRGVGARRPGRPGRGRRPAHPRRDRTPGHPSATTSSASRSIRPRDTRLPTCQSQSQPRPGRLPATLEQHGVPPDAVELARCGSRTARVRKPAEWCSACWPGSPGRSRSAGSRGRRRRPR